MIAVGVQALGAPLLSVDEDNKVADRETSIFQDPRCAEQAGATGHEIVDDQDGLTGDDTAFQRGFLCIGPNVDQRGVTY